MFLIYTFYFMHFRCLRRVLDALVHLPRFPRTTAGSQALRLSDGATGTRWEVSRQHMGVLEGVSGRHVGGCWGSVVGCVVLCVAGGRRPAVGGEKNRYISPKIVERDALRPHQWPPFTLRLQGRIRSNGGAEGMCTFVMNREMYTCRVLRMTATSPAKHEV